MTGVQTCALPIYFHDRFAADIAEYSPKNGAFYRIEKTDVRTYNDAAALGYPGIGQFSSVSSVAQTAFLKKLGYDVASEGEYLY